MPETEQLKDKELLVRLDTKVDNILKRLDTLDSLEKRVGKLEAENCVEDEKINTLGKEVEKLRNQQTFWSTLNSIGIAIGTLFGISR